MANLPETARAAIIGEGDAGASCLNHPGRAGWTDCLLLEKSELAAGSTWHASGSMPTFPVSRPVMNMRRHSAELHRGLTAAADHSINYHVTGSTRLTHSGS